LFLSVLGTSISFAIFASAQTVFMLFIGRILDGLTGGNIAVAQATIADLHKGQKRSQAFGILWSVFGLGFALGPALGGVLSIYGLNVPFWIGSLLALVNAILIFFVLPETFDPAQNSHTANEPIFDIQGMVK